MITSLVLRRTSLVLLTGALSTTLFSGAAIAAGSQSFQISPPTSNYAGDKGTSVSGTIKVTNLTSQPLAVNIDKQNFVAKGEEGEVELVNFGDPLYSLAPWFNFDTTTLQVPGLATKEMHYTIAIPADAEPGGRYGSVTFSTIPPKLSSGESGAAVQQTLGGLIFLRINGAANEQLQVASFAPEKKFSEYGPVKLLTRLKDTGNVHEKATGTITIKNMLGFKVATLPLDEHFVIPGATRRLHNQFPTSNKQALLFGPYTATLNATYAGGKSLTATTSFTVIPYKLLIGILIVLLILFILYWRARKRIARAARILSGKE